jgi:hypothetical protein
MTFLNTSSSVPWDYKPSLINFKCLLFCPTFYGIQLIADHLLRHKGRHVGFCSYLLLVLTSGGDASSSPN